MFKGINHITVVVKNKTEAERFYFDLLDLERLDVGKSLWARVGKQYIHINENPNLEKVKTFRHFSIEVEGLKPYLVSLINKGVDVFDLDGNLEKTDVNSNLDKEMRNYFVEDPSGNIVEFFDSSNVFYKQ